MDTPRRTRVADIAAIAAYIWGVPVLQVTGRQRNRLYTLPRFAVCAIAKEHGHSFPMIGRVLDGRDHSTIIHGARMAEIYAERDPAFAMRLNRLRQLAAQAKPFVAERMAA